MPSLTEIRPDTPRTARFPRWTLWLGLVLVTALVLFGATRIVRGPRFIGQITFENPTPYAVDIEVAGTSRDGWVPLGTMQQNSSTVAGEVVDQGSTWVFRASAQGVSGGDFVISRSTLQESHWRVTIPSAVDDRLHAQHVPIPPPTNY